MFLDWIHIHGDFLPIFRKIFVIMVSTLLIKRIHDSHIFLRVDNNIEWFTT